MVILVDPVPFPVAVIVYVSVGSSTRGVPEIVPVLISRTIPEGKEGVTEKLVAGPPLLITDIGVMGEFCVNVNKEGE